MFTRIFMSYRIFCLLALLLSPAVSADILWMDNGDRLTGTIEEIGDQQVRIALPYSAPSQSSAKRSSAGASRSRTNPNRPSRPALPCWP